MNENEVLQNYKNYLVARKFSLCYPNYISLFLKYCKEQNINYDNITQGILTDFLNHDKYSANTVNLFIKAGRSFYSYLGIPNDQNAFCHIRYVRVPKRKPEYISEERLKSLIKPLPAKRSVLISFLYYTGLRRQELLTLKRQDIDLLSNPCCIKVFGKGEKERFVYFSEKFSPNLREKLIYYFKSEEEKTNAFNISLAQISYLCKKIGIHPHLLRHGFSKMLISKGCPITYLSAMLGHSNLQSTMIYASPTDELIKAYF